MPDPTPFPPRPEPDADKPSAYLTVGGRRFAVRVRVRVEEVNATKAEVVEMPERPGED